MNDHKRQAFNATSYERQQNHTQGLAQAAQCHFRPSKEFESKTPHISSLRSERCRPWSLSNAAWFALTTQQLAPRRREYRLECATGFGHFNVSQTMSPLSNARYQLHGGLWRTLATPCQRQPTESEQETTVRATTRVEESVRGLVLPPTSDHCGCAHVCAEWPAARGPQD